MATIVAQASGNFSAGATWVGGVKPAPGDIAETANFTVTIDENFTGTLRPTGSGYFIVATGGITITGDLVMQSTYTGGGLRCTHTSGEVTLTGTATGGAGSSAHGAYNNAAGTLTVGTATGGAGSNAYGAYNSTSGTLTVGTATGGASNYAYGAYNAAAGTLTVGTATGGAGISAYGAYNNAAGTLTVGTATGGAGNYAYGAYNNAAGTLTVGTATGGAGSSAHGAYNNAAGTLTVGTATGGAGSSAYGAYNNAAGTLICDLAIGSNWGPGGTGNLNSGVYGTGAVGQTTKVRRVQSGAYGAPGIWGFVLIEPDASNSAQFRLTPGGDTLTLVDAAAAADFPAATDVRIGISYDNGDKVGTCAVPVAAHVSAGVPVDDTVGVAVLTTAAVAAGVWDAARSGHAGAGTFGDVAEWAGSVDEAAIATAAAAAILAAADSDPISANVTYSAGVAVSGRLAEVTDLPSEPLDATATQAAAAAALTAYDPPTAAELISAVAAGAAGDPWTAVLPGAYTSDQAGGIVGGLAAIDTSAVTYVTRNNAGDLTITRALTFDETITGLTIPATWVEAIWTLKRSVRQEDSEALLQLKATNPAALTDGLQRLNGASLVAPLSAASGTLTINQVGGTARVWLSDDATAELTEHSTAGYDLKFIDAAGNSTGVRGAAVIDLTETREV